MFCKKYSTALLAACTACILLLSGCNFASQGRSNEEIRLADPEETEQGTTAETAANVNEVDPEYYLGETTFIGDSRTNGLLTYQLLPPEQVFAIDGSTQKTIRDDPFIQFGPDSDRLTVILSLSAHKFHGPKGVGVLYARKGIPLFPLIEGGAQERGRRAGTENLPAIMGMTAALELACSQIDENARHLTALRDQLIQGLAKIPHSVLNGDPVQRLPSNVNFCFEGIEGESLLLLLDDKGICASSGSACTSGSLDPSHVLLAIGRVHDIAHGSLRLSLSEETTEQEVEEIIRAVSEAVAYLREMSPIWRDLTSGKKHFIIQ